MISKTQTTDWTIHKRRQFDQTVQIWSNYISTPFSLMWDPILEDAEHLFGSGSESVVYGFWGRH